MCECGRAKLGARQEYFVFIIRALSPTGRLSLAIFVSDFQDLCYSLLVPQKAARLEARRAWIAGRRLRSRRGSIPVARCRGGASSHVHAPWRRPPRSESERFARKPLNSPDSRKKAAWISLPLALDFLPNDLDFPSLGFGNPSTHFVKSRVSRETTSLSLAFVELRAAGEAPLGHRLRCSRKIACSPSRFHAHFGQIGLSGRP
jgi:hypothetical protein